MPTKQRRFNPLTAHTEDQFFAAQHVIEQRRRNAELEARRHKLEQDFDADLLPFGYHHLKQTGLLMTNIQWLELMMKSIRHVVTHSFALLADKKQILATVTAANNITVRMYDGPEYKCPADLSEMFFDGNVPIYQTHLSELGILLTRQQLVTVKQRVVAEQMERLASYE